MHLTLRGPRKRPRKPSSITVMVSGLATVSARKTGYKPSLRRRVRYKAESKYFVLKS